MGPLEQVEQAAQHIKNAAGPDFRPRVGITLGTGLSQLGSRIEVSAPGSPMVRFLISPYPPCRATPER